MSAPGFSRGASNTNALVASVETEVFGALALAASAVSACVVGLAQRMFALCGGVFLAWLAPHSSTRLAWRSAVKSCVGAAFLNRPRRTIGSEELGASGVQLSLCRRRKALVVSRLSSPHPHRCTHSARCHGHRHHTLGKLPHLRQHIRLRVELRYEQLHLTFRLAAYTLEQLCVIFPRQKLRYQSEGAQIHGARSEQRDDHRIPSG